MCNKRLIILFLFLLFSSPPPSLLLSCCAFTMGAEDDGERERGALSKQPVSWIYMSPLGLTLLPLIRVAFRCGIWG